MWIRRERGYSLIEMVIVVAILSAIAAVAVPGFSSNDESKLELAVADIADAIRFAHSEAIRTGEPHGINADYFAKRIRVYHLDTSVDPFVLHYDMYDPLTKQLYDLRFNTGANDVEIASVYIKFKGAFFPTSFLGFSGGTGLPKYNGSGTVRMLETAYIDLSLDGVTKRISVSPMTARVTVQ